MRAFCYLLTAWVVISASSLANAEAQNNPVDAGTNNFVYTLVECFVYFRSLKRACRVEATHQSRRWTDTTRLQSKLYGWQPRPAQR